MGRELFVPRLDQLEASSSDVRPSLKALAKIFKPLPRPKLSRLQKFIFGTTSAGVALTGCSVVTSQGLEKATTGGTITPDILSNPTLLENSLATELGASNFELVGVSPQMEATWVNAGAVGPLPAWGIDGDLNNQIEGGEALTFIVGEGAAQEIIPFSLDGVCQGNQCELKEFEIAADGSFRMVDDGASLQIKIGEKDGKVVAEETTLITDEGKVFNISAAGGSEEESPFNKIVEVLSGAQPAQAKGLEATSDSKDNPVVVEKSPTPQDTPVITSTPVPPTPTDVIIPTATATEKVGITQLDSMGKYTDEQLRDYFNNYGKEKMNAVLDKALADKVVKPVTSVLPPQWDSHVNEKGEIVSNHQYKGTWVKVVITEQAVIIKGGGMVDKIMKALKDLSSKLKFSVPSLSEELLVTHASFEWESGLRQHLQLVCGPRYSGNCNPSILKGYSVGDVAEVYIPTEAYYVTGSGMVPIDKIPNGQLPSASNTDRAIDFGAGLVALQNNVQLADIKAGKINADSLTPLYFREIK